ncbi:unnamed protein product [Schistosoma margrebowiei]|uniref:Uncharacterized protein n=1 Tax=Schistosoma margrebowiei TaxID=48269 RepID=A0A183M408_9TREM|nr:unnamed protein product [Schistosoma margrebowiei]
MVVEVSQQETVDPGFVLFGIRQEFLLVILRGLVVPDAFDLVSPSFTVTTKPSSKFHEFKLTSEIFKLSPIKLFAVVLTLWN